MRMLGERGSGPKTKAPAGFQQWLIRMLIGCPHRPTVQNNEPEERENRGCSFLACHAQLSPITRRKQAMKKHLEEGRMKEARAQHRIARSM